MSRASFAGRTALLAACLVGCGCGSPTAPTATPTPASDAISLGSIAPAVGTLLHAGQTVTLTATLNYTLTSAASGQIAIIIQDQLNRNLKPPGTQPAVAVMRGTSTAALSDTVTIPDSGVSSVTVFFPLIPAGATRTDVLISVTYPVG